MYNENNELAEAVVKHRGELSDAYQEVYPEITDKRTATMKCRTKILSSYELRGNICKLLDEQGLDLTTATQKLKELMDAQKPVVCDKSIEMVPDNMTQLATTETVLKLHNIISPAPASNTNNINIINIDNDNTIRLQSIINELSNLNTQLDSNSHVITNANAIDI
jgi:hypothetical protein